MDELNNNQTVGSEDGQSETTPKTYTEDEFQSEVDKRVTQALKKQSAKNEAKVKEAQRLAQMSEKEKYEYELNQREQAIIEKEKQLAMAENKNVASKILNEKGLSINLVDFVVDEDADVMNDRIKVLERAFKASVKAEIEKRLGQKSPVTTSVSPDRVTKDIFNKMSLTEQQRFASENPDIIRDILGDN